ncbi:MAG: HlyD family efflux transporter periplasmic adaptor subunit [Dokdonella sp.]
MKSLYPIVVLAIAGVAIAIFAVVDTNSLISGNSSVLSAEQPPFASYVVGSGITESGRGNVAIGTPVPGLVSEVHVQVGDRVNVGDSLFTIDVRGLQAKLAVARANVSQAAAAIAKPRHRLDYLTHLQRLDLAASTAEALSNARDDASVADAALESAKAVAAQIQVDIERSVVRAPAAGRVLQSNARVGEYAVSGENAKPLMLVGDDARMYLRVDVDENDAWQVRPGAEARAIFRGNPRSVIPLRFEYIEPYVIPKTSLTGQSTERSDLRVLQVIFSFERGTLPVYLGQQMDAFIQTAPVVQDPASRTH